MAALRDVSYAADGAWHLVGLGLLIAGIAVPALYFRLLPRWFSVTGVAIAVMCVARGLPGRRGHVPGDGTARAHVQRATDVLWAVGADNGRLHDAGPALTAVILLRICIVVPLAEELLFRGALFTWLRQRLSATMTIAVTAVGFALIHQAPVMLPLALLVGLAAGVIREQTGSTTMPIVLHAAQNVAIVVLSYFVTGWQASFF